MEIEDKLIDYGFDRVFFSFLRHQAEAADRW